MRDLRAFAWSMSQPPPPVAPPGRIGACESCGRGTYKGNSLCRRCRDQSAKIAPSQRSEAARKSARERWSRHPRPESVRGKTGYIAPSRRGVCSECGKTVQVTSTSAPPERRRCRECQRARPRTVLSAWTPQVVQCPCGEMFEQRRFGQKYCRAEHRPDPRRTFRASTSQRGYGHEHRERRVRALAELVPGSPCPRCGGPMWPDSQPLDLDHADDRRDYIGLSHMTCNRSAGATYGNWLRRAG